MRILVRILEGFILVMFWLLTLSLLIVEEGPPFAWVILLALPVLFTIMFVDMWKSG